MDRLSGALFVVGAVAEFAGIVLLGFPDFLPGALRLSRWLRIRMRQLLNRLRRLVGMRPLQTVVHLEAAGEINVGGRLSLTVSVNPEATTEEKLAFLVRRDQETQQAVNALVERVTEIEAQTPRQLRELSDRMEAHVSHELTTALAEYRPLRIAGTVALAAGLACVTVATFV